MNTKMWLKYPLVRIAFRTGATRFGIIPISKHFSLDTRSVPSKHHLGMCEQEFVRGCAHAILTFCEDFLKRDIIAISQYTTPNLTTLLGDQLLGNMPYVECIAHKDVVVNVLAANTMQGFVQRQKYPMGFLRARDFMDGVYGPEKFLIHPCEKRQAIVSFTATETYRVWERGEDGDRSGKALYDKTEPVRYVIQFEHDVLDGRGELEKNPEDLDNMADENWVISGINGYD